MPKAKFMPGERVEVLCYHLRDGQLVRDWLPGTFVEVDHRMAAVQFAEEVFSNNGWPIPDRILWSAHGSPHIRRPEDAATP